MYRSCGQWSVRQIYIRVQRALHMHHCVSIFVLKLNPQMVTLVSMFCVHSECNTHDQDS